MARIRYTLGGLMCAVGVAVVLLVVVGSVGARGTPVVGVVAVSGGGAANQVAAQVAARADAAALLGEVSLPAGATELSSEPAGDEGLLAHAGAGGPATPNVVEAHAWWTVPGSRAEVMAYIRGHAPSGSALVSSGSGGGRGSMTFESVTFAWPAVAGVLSTRWLVLTAARLPHGSTGLRADTQVVWVTPRPESERIPTGARRLSVSATSALMGDHSLQRPFSVASAQRIERIVALLNSLPAAQPGTRACPDDPGIRLVLVFYQPDAASPSAVATIDPYGCGGVQLTIGGRPQAPLGSEALPGTSTTRAPSLIVRIDRVLGVRLRISPRHPSPGAVPAEKSVRSRARPASSYEFEDLTITRQVAADGKPIPGFVSYYRLNRALPFAPRGKFEGEEEGGPRLYAAYLSVDRVHEEGSTETMGDDASRHCYTEAIEVHAHEHQPRIGELVSVSLVIHGRAVINTRTRVRTRKMGKSVRKPNGVLLNQTDLPYEKAFGCLKMSSGRG
jgi:hypothetical protein